MKTRQQVLLIIKPYWMLTIGATIQAFGMAWFLFPHNIPSGGAAGIAIINEYLFGISYGWTLWLLNVPLLFISIKYISLSSAIRTIYAVTISSAWIHFWTNTSYLLKVYWPLSILLGSLFFGIGVGLLFRKDASSGGLAIIAHLLSKYTVLTPGRAMLIINTIVFAITALIVDWKIIILAFISQAISTRIIDFVFNKNKSDVHENEITQ